MSKSKGEFLTVSLLEEKGYDPIAYRLFCLQSHYRRNLVFSWENLDNAAQTYEKLIARIAALRPEDGAVDAEAFEALKAVANGRATKLIIPSEIQGMAGLAASLKEIVADDKQ